MSGLALLLVSAVAPWDAPATVEPQYILDSEARRRPVPARVVTLAPSNTEFVYALGAGDRLVGVSRYADHPPQAKLLPVVGGFLDPNIEKIVSLEPDLIIAAANAQIKPSLERLAQLGLVVLCVPGNSFADTFWAGRAIADALGGDAPAKAAALLGAMQRRAEAVQRSARGAGPVRVTFVYDHTPLVLAGPGSFADSMLDIVGASNAVSVDVAYPVYAIEQMLVDAPDVILDASGQHSGGVESFWARWTTIPAVANKQVHSFDATLMMRAGPRIVDALEAIAGLLNAARGPARSRPPPARRGPDRAAGSGSAGSGTQPGVAATPVATPKP